MLATDPPAVQPSAVDDQSDVIEIVGTRLDQVLKIDRRSYQVQQTPHAAQKDGLQLLRGLPAVTVTPDDQINLLGSGNVTIQIDGRTITDPNTIQHLRTLHGSDIERIEVITNPSAQYSAEGTGGIINFVLRKKQAEGVAGTASALLASPSHAGGNASVKYKRGKWTYEFEAEGDIGQWRRSTYHKRRSVEEAVGAAPTTNTEDGGGPARYTGGSVSGKITYDVDPKTSISAKILGGGSRSSSINHAEFRGVTPGFEPFTERQRLGNAASFLITELNFDHKASKEGETLSASLRAFGNPRQHETNAGDFSNGAALSTDKLKHFLFAIGQVDWQHPLGKGQILSIGGTWNYSRMRERYGFASTNTAASLGADTVDRFTGVEDTLAAYATFQQPIGGWTVMPGLRIERNGRRISSPSQPDVRIARTDLFPTLHVDHKLGKTVDLTLSYSKRIDRPQLNDLRPYPIVQDVLTIKTGNSLLKDQSTDSYEINLHYHRKKVDAGVIVYDRDTKRLWSNDYSAVGEVTIFTPVNAGRRRDRGVEIDVGAPILRRVKVNASLNLFDQRAPIGTAAGATSDTFRYSTNATLEWDGPDHGKRPGDVAQLQWIYGSPQHEFQFRNFAWHWFSLSYTHSFTRDLSLSATANLGPIHNGHRLIAPLVQEYFIEHSRPEFRLKLLKTFGSSK